MYSAYNVLLVLQKKTIVFQSIMKLCFVLYAVNFILKVKLVVFSMYAVKFTFCGQGRFY